MKFKVFCKVGNVFSGLILLKNGKSIIKLNSLEDLVKKETKIFFELIKFLFETPSYEYIP
jgi:hypothetical protein